MLNTTSKFNLNLYLNFNSQFDLELVVIIDLLVLVENIKLYLV